MGRMYQESESEMFRYKEQQDVINRMCDELGVIPFRPNYHHSRGDSNTVMVYFKEDDEYNREIDKKYSALSVETLNGMYRRPFFVFENTDCNGQFSYEWGNHGKIDMRSYFSTYNRLEGAIKLAYYQSCQTRYVQAHGGFAGIYEADDNYNDLNRRQIEAYLMYKGKAFMCDANYHGDKHKAVCNGTESVYTEYNGQRIYNFACQYLVPRKDEELEEMIRDWNRGAKAITYVNADMILRRVKELDGIFFTWF